MKQEKGTNNKTLSLGCVLRFTSEIKTTQNTTDVTAGRQWSEIFYAFSAHNYLETQEHKHPRNQA